MTEAELNTIYCILDPETENVVYIGKTQDFENRQNRYLKSIKKARPRKESIKAWVWDTLKAGNIPLFEVLEVVDSDLADGAKKEWREHFSSEILLFKSQSKIRLICEYTTYCIKDTRTGLVIYVGQTGNFEQRKKSHLRMERRARPNIKTENIKTYLWDLFEAKVMPEFLILETVRTLEESLVSETKWVGHFSEKKHPLLNRSKEHRRLIKDV